MRAPAPSKLTARTIEPASQRVQLAREVEAVIVTRGGAGSTIYADGDTIDIPLAPARHLVDPTGCGDAYRAGLLYGLQHGLDWEITGRIASLIGAIKIEHAGTQNHALTRADFDATTPKPSLVVQPWYWYAYISYQAIHWHRQF